MTLRVGVGNVIGSQWTIPESLVAAVIPLGNISCTFDGALISPVTLTPVQIVPNSFYVTHFVTTSYDPGRYVFYWVCSTPQLRMEEVVLIEPQSLPTNF